MEYKAYTFDLDDNLLKLPTKIYLKTKEGKIKPVSTFEFEKMRLKLDEFDLKIFEDSFKDFRDDKKLLVDIQNSTRAGSFRNLVKCVVKHTSIFAIITARGHSPSAIKKGIKLALLNNLTKEELGQFAKNFIEIYKFKHKGKSNEELLDNYLDLCKFYPVDNKLIKNKFKCNDTSELKYFAFEEFQEYLRNYVKTNFGEDVQVKIGFSDDSPVHLNKMVNNILKKHGLFFYHTSDEGKTNFLD